MITCAKGLQGVPEKQMLGRDARKVNDRPDPPSQLYSFTRITLSPMKVTNTVLVGGDP
jgi:hypothetical protein